MIPEPTLPKWLVEAGEQFTDTWVPLTRMPGVPGPVKVSITGLLAGAYLSGWNDARDQYAAGVPAGSVVFSADEWAMLRDVLWRATGWRQSAPEPMPAPSDDEPSTDVVDVSADQPITEEQS